MKWKGNSYYYSSILYTHVGNMTRFSLFLLTVRQKLSFSSFVCVWCFVNLIKLNPHKRPDYALGPIVKLLKVISI